MADGGGCAEEWEGIQESIEMVDDDDDDDDDEEEEEEMDEETR